MISIGTNKSTLSPDHMDKPIPAAAPTTTNYKLLFKGIGALSFLYLLSYLSATAFFFGLIASLPVQLLMLWLFLGRYSNKYERNLKIEFGKRIAFSSCH